MGPPEWAAGAGAILLIAGLVIFATPRAGSGTYPGGSTTSPVAVASLSPATDAGATPSLTTAAATLAPTPTLTQAQVAAAYEASCQHVTVSQMQKQPATYKGSPLTFSAVIVNFLQDSSGNTGAMNVADPTDGSSIAYVQLSSSAQVAHMNKGDKITVWGHGGGALSGQNAYGGTINEAAVDEVYLGDATSGYQDNSNPSPS